MSRSHVVVVGAGAAGLAAARTARRRGAQVTLVTSGEPGGECTFTGCVPSKTLLAHAGLGFDAAMAQVRVVVARIAATEDADVLRAEGIGVVPGRAEVGPGRRVVVDGTTLAADRVVVATGSRPRLPAIPGLAEVPFLTNEDLFALAALPAHLLVLGGGAVGCEMAQAFSRLGARVTLLEQATRLLAGGEPGASAVVETVLRRDGVDVRTGVSASAVAATGDGVVVHTDSGPVPGSHLLVAVGRAPSTDALHGLRTAESGALVVDDRMRTGVPGVFAAGDVTGLAALTHAADEMGRVAATNALRRWPPARFGATAVPSVVFTDPEVARVGLTESQAAGRVRGARVVELAMSEVDRARTSGRLDGFVKVVVGPRHLTGNLGGGRVLGATVVAERAGEMLAELALAVRTGMFAGRLAQTSHAYPTWSVAVQQAVAQLFGGYGGHLPRPARR